MAERESLEGLDLAEALTELARLCQADGRPAEAEAHYRRALAILDRVAELGRPRRAVIRRHYAALLVELGRDAEAAYLEAGRSPGGSGQNSPRRTHEKPDVVPMAAAIPLPTLSSRARDAPGSRRVNVRVRGDHDRR